MSVKGKVALITGAASGIGKRIAEVLADNGAHIAIADINQAAAQAAADEIKARGVKATTVVMDVTDEGAVEAGVDKAVKDLGSVDILVSNAGIQIVNPVENFSFADWKKMIAIHLDGAFLTARAPQAHVCGRQRRLGHLHGFGAFEGSLETQGAVCRGQARADRPGEGRRQ